MKARKRFGQHFLERAWVDKLVQRIAPAAGDIILEIGPGRGALTVPIAASGARVTAVEVDRDLADDLGRNAPPNVRIITGDFLELSAESLLRAIDHGSAAAPRPEGDGDAIDASVESAADATPHAPGSSSSRDVRVVGNLPYNISSPILFRLLQLSRETGRLIDATLMLQREVAVRIAAGPGSGDYGPLGILTAIHADVDRLLELPPGAFRPAPKVHSSVLKLRFRPSPVEIDDYPRFERMVRTLFQQRRKMINNALAPMFQNAPVASTGDTPALANSVAAVLERAGIDGRRRPETLTLAELARLAKA
jgi:16S rRNA (adenine1518-N6/adenine1519-N6)-dimethyltransferase